NVAADLASNKTAGPGGLLSGCGCPAGGTRVSPSCPGHRPDIASDTLTEGSIMKLDTEQWSLSATETPFFHANAYIGPITVYTPAEMDAMWRNIRRDIADRSHAAYPIDALSGATNIANYDRHLDIDLLASHVCNQKITNRVASILGPNVLCWRTEF